MVQQHYISVFSLSLTPSFSDSPSNFPLHVFQPDYVSAGRRREKKNKNSEAGIHLNTLTPLNQPMVRFFYRFMANAAGACPTSSPGLWHQHQHVKGKGAFRVTERGAAMQERSEEKFDPKQSGGRWIQRAEVWINTPCVLAHTLIQRWWEDGKARLNFENLLGEPVVELSRYCIAFSLNLHPVCPWARQLTSSCFGAAEWIQCWKNARVQIQASNFTAPLVLL